MRNPKPKTTAVGVLREGSALIGRASSLSIKGLGMLIGLAHNALDATANASSTTVELTKEGYQQSRQQDNPPTQRELPLDDHPA
tara:strand:+ start:822 stop:1073 length:252 start_codon:yes stop_codon:yes gene_type:complete